MKCILKYIIYLLITTFIFLIFNRNLVEGLDDDAFPFLARIIGKNNDEILDYKTDYIGCHNYECDNKIVTKEDVGNVIIDEFYERPYYLSRETGVKRGKIENLLHIANNRDNLDESNAAYDKLKELYVNMFNTRKYVKRKNIQSDVCNNHMDYSPAANIVGNNASHFSQDALEHGGIPDGRCNHELCCFDTKCSSKDNYDIHSAAAPAGSDICGRGYTLKRDAHCFTYDDCNNPDKFKEYCCESNNTDEIDDIFDTINTGTDNTKVLFWNSYWNGWVIGHLGAEIGGDGSLNIAYGGRSREQEDPATGPRYDGWIIKNPEGGLMSDDSIRVTISGEQSPYENEFSPETEVYYVGGSRNHPDIDGLYYKQEEAINGYSYYIKHDEDNTISWDELSEWYNNISQNNEDINTQKLDKFLSITDGESVELSRMDLKDLLNE